MEPETVRPLGDLERVYDLWRRENALSFAVIGKLDRAIEVEQLQAALGVVQARHPLLASTIVDQDSDVAAKASVFVHTQEPISVQVWEGKPWTKVVGDDLAVPFLRDTSPLLRAHLVDGDHIVLTFEHTIADGLSAAAILHETVACLDGAELPPLPAPASQDDLVRELPPPPPAKQAFTSTEDPRMLIPGTIHPAQEGSPVVHTLAWTRQETDELLRRCREHKTTVTGALAAAAAHVSAGDHEFLRVSIPYTLDPLVSDTAGCSVNIGKVTLGWPVEQLTDVWATAREGMRIIHQARERPAVDEAVAELAQVWNGGLSSAQAMEIFVVVNSFELMVTNIGRLGFEAEHALLSGVQIGQLWGPLLLNQQYGQQLIGAATWRGQLRLIMANRAPSDLLVRVKDLLLG